MCRMPCQALVDMLIEHGMTAVYTTAGAFRDTLKAMDKDTVLIYAHDRGEDVILLGDNEIDHVTFKFNPYGERIR